MKVEEGIKMVNGGGGVSRLDSWQDMKQLYYIWPSALSFVLELERQQNSNIFVPCNEHA